MPAPALTDEQILEIARACGFHEDIGGIAGKSPLDELAYLNEYPVGELLVRFARAVLARE